MEIRDIIWVDNFVDKMARKHAVLPDEVEEVFADAPVYRKVQRGHVPGENLFSALGKTTAGRHLAVFFIRKRNGDILIISAREMDARERKRYARQ